MSICGRIPVAKAAKRPRRDKLAMNENIPLPFDLPTVARKQVSTAGIETELGCHSFRATGITVYLQNGGLLEHTQQMAAHESARTTTLYDRRNDKVTLDEVKKIML